MKGKKPPPAKRKSATRTKPGRARPAAKAAKAVKATPAIPSPPKVKKKAASRVKSIRVKTLQETVRKAPAPVVETAAPSKAKAPTPPAPAIPAILLEGDTSTAPPPSGPGQRYALAPRPPVASPLAPPTLPKAYATKSLLLTARDPHWLYAHWDLTDEQQREYNSQSADGHLVVRAFVNAIGSAPATEVHVHPESRHWFVHVDKAGTRYLAQLGYYTAAGRWEVISTSAATMTPPDQVSPEIAVEFAAVPFEPPFEKLLSLVKEAVIEHAPLAAAIQELREQGHSALPAPQPTASVASVPSFPSLAHARPGPPPRAIAAKPGTVFRLPAPSQWTPAQERALAEVVSMDHVRRVWMGSMEITELIRQQYFKELASMAAAALAPGGPGAPTSPGEAPGRGAISSPAGGGIAETVQREFWFNVNAELIIYGATEPTATVTIGERPIKLRPDGSFSYRFALPDGQYELPIIAISADRTDGRAAILRFSRGTEHRGDVGTHPQDSELNTPDPANV